MTIEGVIVPRAVYIHNPKLLYLFQISVIWFYTKFVDFLPRTYPCTWKKLMAITLQGVVNRFLMKSVFRQ